MTQHQIISVWQKAHPITGYNPNLLRIDDYGNPISFTDYGKNSKFGWEVDHIFPKSMGGNDNITNLQPLHWYANRVKSDNLNY